jgi:hypothetical protein
MTLSSQQQNVKKKPTVWEPSEDAVPIQREPSPQREDNLRHEDIDQLREDKEAYEKKKQ